MHLRTTFLWTMIVSLSLAAALGVIAILFENLWRSDEEALVTSLLVGAFSMICLACAFVLEKHRVRGLMWTGIGCSLAALAVWLVMVWAKPWRWGGPVDWDELLFKSSATFTVICLWSAHLGMMILLRLTASKPRVVRTLTLGLVAVLGVTIIGMAWFEVNKEWMFKLIAVLSILGACGTVVTPILALIEYLARKGSAETIPVKVRLHLTCPRCHTQQQLAAGRGKCSACGLRITIDVEEPRCACGYLLYELKGDRCPECGREISEVDRWAATT